MKTFALAALLGQLASSQLIDLAFIESQPDPTYTIATDQVSQNIPYNQAATIAQDGAEFASDELPLDVPHEKRSTPMRIERRQAACAALPTTANVYNADLSSVKAFQQDANLAAQALGATVAPAGYTTTFSNKQASAQFAQGYMGFVRLTSYDTAACAKQCNSRKLCQAFNVYFARDPSVRPGAGCENPQATANIMCTLYGGIIAEGNALNVGGWQSKFQTAVAGSNSYVKTTSLGQYSNKAINAPQVDCTGEDPYMGMRAFPDGNPFDPARCAAVCAETNDYAIKNAEPGKEPRLCRFYNTYVLSKNDRTQGAVCSLYTRAWDPAEFAVNDGQYDQAGNHFTISSSVISAFNASSPEPSCTPVKAKACTASDPVAFRGSYTNATADSNRFQRSTITTPFDFCVFSVCSRSIEVSLSGFMTPTRDSAGAGRSFNIDVNNHGWEIVEGQSEYISLGTCGAEGKRESKVEWRVQASAATSGTTVAPPGYYRWSATFYEDKPGVIRYNFNEMAINSRRGSAAMYESVQGQSKSKCHNIPSCDMVLMLMTFAADGFAMPNYDSIKKMQVGDQILFDTRGNNTITFIAAADAY